jgi:hypothetical protein
MKKLLLILSLFVVKVYLPNQPVMVFETVRSFNIYPSSTMVTLYLEDGRTFYVPTNFTIIEKQSEFPRGK